MGVVWPSRLAWLGALLGLMVALVLFAPARWLAQVLGAASQGQVQLVNAQGTVWQGRADLLLTGGEGSRSRTALPQGLQWRLRPGWQDSGPAIRLQLVAPCCVPQGLAMTALPGWGRARLQVDGFDSHWPAELLTGLGTPWNTLRLEGRLQVQSTGLNLHWAAGRSRLDGGLDVVAHDLASRLSTLRPLGSYRFTLQAAAGSDSASLALQTLHGDLQLQGEGRWVGGRLRFRGEAQAAPGREAALANLLNIIGRRNGARSVLNIG